VSLRRSSARPSNDTRTCGGSTTSTNSACRVVSRCRPPVALNLSYTLRRCASWRWIALHCACAPSLPP
jgi:hypothetical protein